MLGILLIPSFLLAGYEGHVLWKKLGLRTGNVDAFNSGLISHLSTNHLSAKSDFEPAAIQSFSVKVEAMNDPRILCKSDIIHDQRRIFRYNNDPEVRLHHWYPSWNSQLYTVASAYTIYHYLTVVSIRKVLNPACEVLYSYICIFRSSSFLQKRVQSSDNP